MHWCIILDLSSALETRTTTRGQARVQWRTKVAGGTTAVVTPTWTATTTTPASTHQSTMMVWCGGTGRATGTRWDSLKWKSDRFNVWPEWQHFVSIFLSWTVTPVLLSSTVWLKIKSPTIQNAISRQPIDFATRFSNLKNLKKLLQIKINIVWHFSLHRWVV